MLHRNRPPSDRPARPGRVLPPLPVGEPDPGPQRREHAANECCNECCMCGAVLSARRLHTCARRGDSPFCVRCAATIRASRRAEDARERAWQKQKARRWAAREREQNAWREGRRQEKVAAWVAEDPEFRSEADYPWDGVVLGRR